MTDFPLRIYWINIQLCASFFNSFLYLLWCRYIAKACIFVLTWTLTNQRRAYVFSDDTINILADKPLSFKAEFNLRSVQNRKTTQLVGCTKYYNMAANEWRRLVFMNILDVSPKSVFLTNMFENLLFFSASANRNLPYKWFVIEFFVKFLTLWNILFCTY